MGQISDIQNPWRNLLLTRPASFRDIAFYVETGSLASGRRTVVHEYPKRNTPYAEDMGRHAQRWNFSGYLIYRVNPAPGFYPYVQQRVKLLKALDDDDIGKLFHPVLAPSGVDVMCERYNMTESRERGGYTQFEMAFVQAGKPGNSFITVNTNGNVALKASALDQAAVNGFNAATDPILSGQSAGGQ